MAWLIMLTFMVLPFLWGQDHGMEDYG